MPDQPPVPSPLADESPQPADGPFPPDVVAAITRHMNADHAADCLAICRALGGVPAATAARMTGLTGEAFAFAATVGGAEVPVRVPFAAPVTERAQVRAEAVRMTQEARTRLTPNTSA